METFLSYLLDPYIYSLLLHLDSSQFVKNLGIFFSHFFLLLNFNKTDD